MRHLAISILAVLGLVAGCAAPTTSVSRSGSGEDGSALPAGRDVAGTWHGSYWNLPLGNSYADDADCTLQINEDSTFTAKCTRSAIGTNNIARSSTWSGHVVTTAHGIVLQDNGGSWPSIVLRRHGNDTLYATTLDPLVGATIEMEFERGPRTTAGTGGS
jgi:hypothetical protein